MRFGTITASSSLSMGASIANAPSSLHYLGMGKRGFFSACGAIVLISLYWHGAVRQLTEVNTDMATTDQAAYMAYARNLYESEFSHPGDRNRMPLYPALQALLYDPSLDEAEKFQRGKYVNLLLSLGLLGVVSGLFARTLPPRRALAATLISAFTVFIFRAGYIQAELLYYTLAFVLFLLFLRLLEQEAHYRTCIGAGIVAGIAHLTKASALPGLLLFLAVFMGRASVSVIRSKSTARAFLLHGCVPALLVALGFLITVYPYISTSKERFGRYFYNVNSTFYVWYDSWEEAKRGTKAHGDRDGWPRMPPDEIPSLSKYVREHSVRQMVGRVTDGVHALTLRVRASYGYHRYLLLYSGALIALLAVTGAWRSTHRILRPSTGLFIAAYFVSYTLLYSWYVPIASGNRLILALFLPLLFVLTAGVSVLLDRYPRASRWFDYGTLLLVAVDIWIILTGRIVEVRGGG